MKKILLSCILLVSVSIAISSCGNADAKTYQCPMKCEGDAVTYDSAGKCPMCGMEMAELK